MRTCWALSQGARGLVTAGARSSPQALIVAAIAKELRIPARIHVPSGEDTESIVQARELGAKIIKHRPGYNSVIIARARRDSENTGFKEIPFGMQSRYAIRQTAAQVKNLPIGQIKRLIVPVGSGMSLLGIIQGLQDLGANVPILAVWVGADPKRRLSAFCPDWRDRIELVKSDYKYDKYLDKQIGPIDLDPIYEAKLVKYLRPGDLFWLVGIRGYFR